MDKEAQLRKAQGRAPLQRSADEPAALFEDLQAIWNGWWQLGGGRNIGMAVSGLTWGEMSRWCEDHGICGEERLRCIRLLQAMDATALEVWRKGKATDANA